MCHTPPVDGNIANGSDIVAALSQDRVIHENMVFMSDEMDRVELTVLEDPVVHDVDCLKDEVFIEVN